MQPLARASRLAVRLEPYRPGDRRRIPQARSASDGQEPGDVRDNGRRGADHDRHLHRERGSRTGHPDRALALVHGPVRQLRRSRRRGPRQGAGGKPAQGAARDHSAAPARRPRGESPGDAASEGRRRCLRRQATSSRPTARSSKASPASTRRPSRANRRRSSARRAATAAPSRAARPSSATASSSASRRRRATASSTA